MKFSLIKDLHLRYRVAIEDKIIELKLPRKKVLHFPSIFVYVFLDKNFPSGVQ